jgi:hypothetical protein
MELESLGPLATLLVASVALFVGLRTVRQRDRADRRAQWWKRAQWATDLTLSDDPHRRELGYTALEVLAGSSLAGPEELDLLDVALTVELSRRPAVLDDGWLIGDDGRQTPDDQSGEAP